LGGLKTVTIGKELLQAARGARSRYFVYLAENKDAEEKVGEKILEIKVKKQRMQKNVKALHKAAIELAKEQEVYISQFTLLTLSN